MSEHKSEYVGVVSAGGLAERASKEMTPERGEGGVVLKALGRVPNTSVTLLESAVNAQLKGGAKLVVVTVGPHERLSEFIADAYPGKNVYAYRSETPHGTAGDLRLALKDKEIAKAMGSTRLIVHSTADTLHGAELDSAVAWHRLKTRGKSGLTTIVTDYPNVPKPGSYYVADDGDVLFAAEASLNLMTKQDAARRPHRRGSSTGVMVIDVDVIESVPWKQEAVKLNLDTQVLTWALLQGITRAVFAKEVGKSNVVLDLGTVAAWKQAQVAEMQQVLSSLVHEGTSAR